MTSRLGLDMDEKQTRFASAFPPLFFSFFFFYRECWLLCVNSALMHCSRDSQTSLFSNFFIKNGSHGTIHTFKNYFVTMFLVFSFQLYPNGPLVTISNKLVTNFISCTIHGTHKHHFSATFSLKMGPTVLFTHLKIILLQCFQFSAVSKRTPSNYIH